MSKETVTSNISPKSNDTQLPTAIDITNRGIIWDTALKISVFYDIFSHCYVCKLHLRIELNISETWQAFRLIVLIINQVGTECMIVKVDDQEYRN